MYGTSSSISHQDSRLLRGRLILGLATISRASVAGRVVASSAWIIRGYLRLALRTRVSKASNTGLFQAEQRGRAAVTQDARPCVIGAVEAAEAAQASQVVEHAEAQAARATARAGAKTRATRIHPVATARAAVHASVEVIEASVVVEQVAGAGSLGVEANSKNVLEDQLGVSVAKRPRVGGRRR